MNIIEEFGKEVIQKVRDYTYEDYLMIKSGKMKSLEAQTLFKIISELKEEDKEKLDSITLNIIDRVIHNFLFLFESSDTFAIAIKTNVDAEQDLSEISDGLTGELYGDQGWINVHSGL